MKFAHRPPSPGLEGITNACIAGLNSSSPPFAKLPPTLKLPATSCSSAPATSASSAPASTPTSSSARAPSTRSSPSFARRWTPSARSSCSPPSTRAKLWEESGRWTGMGQNMFRLTDRKGADLALGMTHEEVMTSIARNELRSYKQLPQIWYQIQTKFRDEPRPKSGLLRVRQFLMKDAYSFDIDEAGLDLSYDAHDRVYRRIFTRCGLEFVAVEADSGAMGGSQSQEFMVYTEAGEDLIASSPSGYAANLEKATSTLAPVDDLAPTGDGLPELVHTPGKASIADVTAFFSIQRLAGHQVRRLHGRAKPVVPHSRLIVEWDTPPPCRCISARRPPGQRNQAQRRRRHRRTAPHDPEELALHIGGPAGFLGPIGIPQVMTQGSLNGLNSGKPLDKLKGVSRDNPGEGLKTIVVMDLGLEGRTQPRRRRQPARLPLPQRDPRPRLHPHPHRRHPQHPRRRTRPHRRPAPAPRQSRRDRPHLQARPQVHRVHGRHRPQPRRQGSHAHHGQLRHRRRAHPHRRHRNLRRSSQRPAISYALPAAIAPFEVVVTITNIKRSAPGRGRRKDRRRPRPPPASTSCSTTATSAPASSSRTPTSPVSPIASPSAKSSPKARSSSSTGSRTPPPTSPSPTSPPPCTVHRSSHVQLS